MFIIIIIRLKRLLFGREWHDRRRAFCLLSSGLQGHVGLGHLVLRPLKCCQRSPSRHRWPEHFLWFWTGLAKREEPADGARSVPYGGVGARRARWQIFSHFYFIVRSKTFRRRLKGEEKKKVWRPDASKRVTYTRATPSLSPGRSQVVTRLTPTPFRWGIVALVNVLPPRRTSVPRIWSFTVHSTLKCSNLSWFVWVWKHFWFINVLIRNHSK